MRRSSWVLQLRGTAPLSVSCPTLPVLAVAMCVVSGACAGRPAPGDVALPYTPPGAIVPGRAGEVPVRAVERGQHLAAFALPTPPADRPPCDILQKLAEARELLADMPVWVGKTEYVHTERRNGQTVRLNGAEKQIAAALLAPEACELIPTTFRKRGDELVASRGYVIEPVQRANGIRWNNWATEYRVLSPEGLFILAVKYPHRRETVVARTVRTATGNRKVVHEKLTETVNIVHTPYNDALRTPEMVGRGIAYLQDVVGRARNRLRDAAVPSRAFPDLLLTDVPQLRTVFTARRAPNEHMEETEFSLDPARTSDRIHVIIGANGPTTSNYTCSPARACGLWQFTEGTYRQMRRLYPEANLLADFTAGWRDHMNIAAAAILLDDSNLSQLIEEFGAEIAADPLLEEYLTAAYNTGVTRVIEVLKAARAGNVADWTEARGKRCARANRYAACMLAETKGYIAKLRYLRDQWPQRLAARAYPCVWSADLFAHLLHFSPAPPGRPHRAALWSSARAQTLRCKSVTACGS